MLTADLTASIRRLDGFDDPELETPAWQRLLDGGSSRTVFLTKWWQATWWKTFGRGELLLFGWFSNGELAGIAPLFADGGMIFFVGSGGSDYLDFIGPTPQRPVLETLLEKSSDCVPGFLGFRFYHVPEESGTGPALEQAAQKLGLVLFDEGSLGAPRINLISAGKAAVHKKSLVRHQRYFEREGALSVRHLRSASEILPRLDSFFEQHIARWAVTEYPSLFLDQSQREFYQKLSTTAEQGSWLRFTEVLWNAESIAFHFGFNYRDTYMWYKPSFAIDLAKRSPGEVLLRNLLIEAIAEKVKIFDLGLGEEAFKQRFATHVPVVRTWGLYPRCNGEITDGSRKH